MDLSTVVVHYRSLDTIPTCLNALEDATRGMARETVVVDNASDDGVAAWIAREHPRRG
jgi:GT2 family glycosyltransferase